MSRRLVSSLAVLVLASSARPVQAQTADQIVERYVAAIGGRDALAAVETMRYVRTVLNTQDGVTAQQSRKTFYTKRPYFYRTEDEETGRVYISDGRSAWSGQPAADSDSIMWEEASFVLRSRDLDFDRLFGSFIDFAGKGHSAEFVGAVELEGVPLEIVRVTWKEGDRWDFYFESSTGLCYGMNPNPERSQRIVRVTDYRDANGILVPHRNMSIDTLPDGGTRLHERLYSEIVFNVELDVSIFLPGTQ
jgi:hypothetical protein